MNYSVLKYHCELHTNIGAEVIDNELIYYADGKENLGTQMDSTLKKYKHVARDLEPAYINYLKSEFIAHKIFRKGGLIQKYLKHATIKALPQEQYAHLEFQAAHPWRFSFAQVLSSPEDSFYQMQDVVTGEEYLLYSPGMHGMKKEMNPRIWFNLIADNGKCWQTFGLIIPLNALSVDDLFFFATELNPAVCDEESLYAEVEKNPFAFFMLLSVANIPVTISRGYEMAFCTAEDELGNFSAERFRKDFDVEWNKNIYQLKSKESGEFPHFAAAYYNETTKVLLRFAMTEYGFASLTHSLAKAGLQLSDEADILVSPVMLSATKRILNKRIELNPYEKLFEQRSDEKSSDNLERMNKLLAMIIPLHNSGKEINIAQLAAQAGVDEKTAAEIWEQMKKKLK